MAKRPVPQIVQQRRDEQHFRVMSGNEGGKPGVFRQLRHVPQRIVKHAQHMFEPGMRRTGIDERDQSQLADLPQPLEFGGIDEGADPACERNIQFTRNPQDFNTRRETGDLRDFQQGIGHARSLLDRPVGKKANAVFRVGWALPTNAHQHAISR